MSQTSQSPARDGTRQQSDHHVQDAANIATSATTQATQAQIIPIEGGRVLLRPNVEPDALEIGDLYRKARTSVADSVRYLIEAGHRLTKKKDEVGRGNWLPWLADNADVLGFDSRFTAAKLMRVATQCAVNGTLDEAQALRLNRVAWGNNVRGTEGTGENEWFTPGEYIEAAREVLGGIDLDPATHPQAQTIVQAAQVFTKEDDGLRHEWHGRVWLNPPYAQPLIAQFVSKMCAERTAGRVTAAIMLTHNYTDTAWFQEAMSAADAICFTRGRVKFYELDGGVAAPTQGQAFFYFGDDIERFEAAFAHIGNGVTALWDAAADAAGGAS